MPQIDLFHGGRMQIVIVYFVPIPRVHNLQCFASPFRRCQQIIARGCGRFPVIRKKWGWLRLPRQLSPCQEKLDAFKSVSHRAIRLVLSTLLTEGEHPSLILFSSFSRSLAISFIVTTAFILLFARSTGSMVRLSKRATLRGSGKTFFGDIGWSILVAASKKSCGSCWTPTLSTL